MQEVQLSLNLALKELTVVTFILVTLVSQAVNILTGGSKIDYINRFRVGLLKELKDDHQNRNYKLMVLARQAGFASKTKFISIFRQHAGMSPGDYYSFARKQGGTESDYSEVNCQNI